MLGHILVLVVGVSLWRRSYAGTKEVEGFRPADAVLSAHEDHIVRTPTYRNGTLDVVCPASNRINIDYRGGAAPTTLKDRVLSRKRTSRYHFSLFQKGDGSDEDPEGIPTRYQLMHPGNRVKALDALKATLDWREKNDIDTLVQRPRSKFDVAKAVFPHYFAGRDKTGHVVFVQRPGLLSLELAKKNGLSKEDLLGTW